MRPKSLRCLALSAAIAVFGAAPVAATPVPFNVTTSAFTPGAGYGVDANEGSGTLLDVVFSANNMAHSFSLAAPGATSTFDFGVITLQESGQILAAETDDLGVSATFDFIDPFLGTRSLTATGSATVGPIVDVAIDLSIDWNPLLVSYGNGGSFTINMNTLNFRQSGQTLTQTATIRLLTEATSVPEPASVALVGLALAALGLSRRR